ncbi:hypothetical protein V8E53_005284 [Lactarius tabidus]
MTLAQSSRTLAPKFSPSALMVLSQVLVSMCVVGCSAVLASITFWSSLKLHLAFAWETQALFDALVFTLIVTRTLKMRKLHNMEFSLSGMGLLDVFLRDGAIYLAVMALANLANIFTFYFSRVRNRPSTPSDLTLIVVVYLARTQGHSLNTRQLVRNTNIHLGYFNGCS